MIRDFFEFSSSLRLFPPILYIFVVRDVISQLRLSYTKRTVSEIAHCLVPLFHITLTVSQETIKNPKSRQTLFVTENTSGNDSR